MSVASCGCDATFAGLAPCHCLKCHASFADRPAYDAHRRLARPCLHPAVLGYGAARRSWLGMGSPRHRVVQCATWPTWPKRALQAPKRAAVLAVERRSRPGRCQGDGPRSSIAHRDRAIAKPSTKSSTHDLHGAANTVDRMHRRTRSRRPDREDSRDSPNVRAFAEQVCARSPNTQVDRRVRPSPSYRRSRVRRSTARTGPRNLACVHGFADSHRPGQPVGSRCVMRRHAVRLVTIRPAGVSHHLTRRFS